MLITLGEYFDLNPRQIQAINRLVAKKIMGWEYHEYSNSPDQMTNPDIPPENGIVQVRNIPKYAENIGSAWEVYEKMLTKHSHSGSDSWEILNKVTDLPCVSFYRNEIKETSYRVRSETVPLAICICALLTVGVDVNLLLDLHTEYSEIL